MHCPFCLQPLQETDPACGRCGFSLAGCDAHFGVCPAMRPVLSDDERRLSRSAAAKVQALARGFERRFPQSHFTLLLKPAPPGAHLRAWLFWLFNRGTLHSAVEKGGENRHVVLWIDPESGRAAAILGYGLEPLVPLDVLNQALAAAAESLGRRDFAQAAAAFLLALEPQLRTLSLEVERTFGLCPKGHWLPIEDADPLDWAQAPASVLAAVSAAATPAI